MDPLKSRQPLYSRQITCPRLICPHRTNTFRTSEKRTPLNSEQWTLMSPRHTLANTKLPPKTDSETTPTNSFVHIASGFCKIVCHHRWPDSIILALLLIVLAFFSMIQQRRGPKMRPHRVQQPEHTLPHLYY